MRRGEPLGHANARAGDLALASPLRVRRYKVAAFAPADAGAGTAATAPPGGIRARPHTAAPERRQRWSACWGLPAPVCVHEAAPVFDKVVCRAPWTSLRVGATCPRVAGPPRRALAGVSPAAPVLAARSATARPRHWRGSAPSLAARERGRRACAGARTAAPGPPSLSCARRGVTPAPGRGTGDLPARAVGAAARAPPGSAPGATVPALRGARLNRRGTAPGLPAPPPKGPHACANRRRRRMWMWEMVSLTLTASHGPF
jgi:hypothetical protein